MEFKSGNPTFREDSFHVSSELSGPKMTIEWAIQKSYLLLWITIVSAISFWILGGTQYILPGLLGGGITAFILALIITFAPKSSPYLSPFYALFEWIFLAAISLRYDAMIPWIVIQGVCLTFGIFLLMLIAYQTKLIRPTQTFKNVIILATAWIFFMYVINFILVLLWIQLMPFIHQGGVIGIWFSLVVVTVAALNLILDFDFISEASEENLPKYYEWYTAFSLLVTLAWLYVELLRLLSKLRWD